MQISDREFEDIISFARRLIRTRSPTGAEADLAQLIQQEMQRIGYDSVHRDEFGNVLGIMKGRSDTSTFMLNGHMDHVDVTDHEQWQHKPFDAHLDDECLHGRGSVDMKASLAAMVHCAVLIKSWFPNFPGRIVTAAVVSEESGIGLGTRQLLHEMRPDAAIVGEPTANHLVIGHRGKAELLTTVRGKSCHASMPDQGLNPLFAMAEFIKRLSDLNLPADQLLGAWS